MCYHSCIGDAHALYTSPKMSIRAKRLARFLVYSRLCIYHKSQRVPLRLRVTASEPACRNTIHTISRWHSLAMPLMMAEHTITSLTGASRVDHIFKYVQQQGPRRFSFAERTVPHFLFAKLKMKPRITFVNSIQPFPHDPVQCVGLI